MQKNREFVDEANIRVRGGDGGNGAVAFRREKYRPKGGPDGGNGGAGGSVILRATPGVATLGELARHPHQRADRGAHGRGSDQHGSAAADRVVAVPLGTLVRDEDGSVLADLTSEGSSFVAAGGGRGGRGNASLTTVRRRAPGFAERGEPGVERTLSLELRVIADVGLVGLPNAGKSSLIARLSAARPKVADYPFTTLSPNLGVAEAAGTRFVVADIPGLVDGAAQGRGLGLEFLRHLQRCRVLCFVIDVAGDDASEALRVLKAELVAYDPSLLDRSTIVAGNKIDLVDAPAMPEDAPRSYPISALTGEGVEQLADALARAVEEALDKERASESPTLLRIRPEGHSVEVLREDAAYRVRSPRVEQVVARFDLDNPDAVTYIQERLVSLGVEEALARAGAKAGDEVRIGDAVFEFIPEAHGVRG